MVNIFVFNRLLIGEVQLYNLQLRWSVKNGDRDEAFHQNSHTSKGNPRYEGKEQHQSSQRKNGQHHATEIVLGAGDVLVPHDAGFILNPVQQIFGGRKVRCVQNESNQTAFAL